MSSLWGRFRSAWDVLRKEGAAQVLETGRMFLAQRVLRAQPDLVQHRYLLGEPLARQLDYRIARGPFEGLRMDPSSSWSGGDRGGILLGLYEEEVLKALDDLADGRTPFVDVGAADGYYAVGMLVTGRCPRATCFEMSDAGRQVIASNAVLNNVAPQMTIRGVAGQSFLDEIPPECWAPDRPALFLFDIEGAEFALLTDEVLERLSTSRGVVELHAPLDHPDVRALLERFQRHFVVDLIRMGPRDPSGISMLESWPDNDRWLLCSESRAYVMHWLVFKPR